MVAAGCAASVASLSAGAAAGPAGASSGPSGAFCAGADLKEMSKGANYDAWAGSEYEGGRHQRRVDQISALESGGIPLARPPPTATEARPPRVITLGEILVEVMRPRAGMPLSKTGSFAGPFPSGAPAIFIDAVARLGHGAAIVGAVGRDGFGENVLQRLEANGVCTALIDEVADLPTATAHVSYDHDGSRAVT